jgi:fumarylacetoacetate (FAA) hydrolase
MKLVSYFNEDHAHLAIFVDGLLYDLDRLHPDLPVSMAMFLNYWEDIFPIAHSLNKSLIEGNRKFTGVPFDSVDILAPVPAPTSFREASAFLRPEEMEPRTKYYPRFSFANHNSVHGPGEVICMPDHFKKLDFGLQVAAVIGKPCRNVRAVEADEYIAGYMIVNAFRASGFVDDGNAGKNAAKARDFATTSGPMLVSLDELEEYILPERENHPGKSFNLDMICRVNGEQVCQGILGHMEWNFAEIIERCSYGVQLYPGDIISSGTVQTGSFEELNAIAKQKTPDADERWLKEGDVIEMEVEELGILQNVVVKDESDFSLTE